jgi:hypothetical protein
MVHNLDNRGQEEHLRSGMASKVGRGELTTMCESKIEVQNPPYEPEADGNGKIQLKVKRPTIAQLMNGSERLLCCAQTVSQMRHRCLCIRVRLDPSRPQNVGGEVGRNAL